MKKKKMTKNERRAKLHIEAVVNLWSPYLGAFFQAAFLHLIKYTTHKDLDELEKALAHFKEKQEKGERCLKSN